MNVSVVIPTLNEIDNLPSCLDNLLPQTKRGDEVIVVDGGSDDGTIETAVQAGCQVFVAEDSSIGEARNIGTEKANNPVVAQTDADALPPEGWLDRIRSHFKQNDELAVLWGTIKDRNGVPIRNLTGKFSTVLRGASGNNTAYTKEAFDKLKSGYPDISFMEDFAIISKLARVGKSVRDNGLVMVMNMERGRYQTIPMTGLSLGSFLIGDHLGGKWKEIGAGLAVGNLGTELVYERMTDGHLHHDEVGALIAVAGRFIKGDGSDIITGLGLGVVTHHLLTEGFSALPTELERNTDIIIQE